MQTKQNRFTAALLALCLLIGSVAVFSSCGSRTTAKFEFSVKDARIEYSEIVGVHYATVTVVTTCVKGRFYDSLYPHNVEGGRPTLYLSDGTGIEGEAEFTAAHTKVDLRKGDSVEYSWAFDVPKDFKEGDYTVRVEWFGSEQTFEGVTFSKAE